MRGIGLGYKGLEHQTLLEVMGHKLSLNLFEAPAPGLSLANRPPAGPRLTPHPQTLARRRKKGTKQSSRARSQKAGVGGCELGPGCHSLKGLCLKLACVSTCFLSS